MSPRGKAKAKKDVGANGKERRVRESRNVKAASYKDLSDSDDDKPIQKRKKDSDSESMSEEEKPKRVVQKGRRASARSRKEEVSDSEEASDFASSDESSGGDSRKRKKPARTPTRSTRASKTSYKDLSNSEEDSIDDEEVDSDSEKEKSPAKKGKGKVSKSSKKVKKDESSEEEEEAEAEEEDEDVEEEEEEDENEEPNDSKSEKSAASKTSGEKAKDKKVDKEGSKKVGKEGPKKADKEGSKKVDKEGPSKKVEKEGPSKKVEKAGSDKKVERPEHELSEDEEEEEEDMEEEEEEEDEKKDTKASKKETDEKTVKKDKDEKSTKKEKDVKTTKMVKDEKTTDKDEKTTKTETDETTTKMETDENDSKKRGRTGKNSDDAADEESDDEPQAKKAKAVDKPMLNKTDSDFKSIDFTSNAKTKEGNEWNLKISSWNVAGLKALAKKNGLDFIKHENPDILCLQETKCSEKKLPPEAKVEGYHAYWLMGEKEGYAGVGILSKTKPLDVKYGVGKPEFDNEGRVITAEYEKFFLVNTYVPNAGQGLKSLPRRLEWDPVFRAYLKTLDEKKPVILCGDLNVAHSEIDLANPKTNTKSAGFTPQEREGMTALLKEGFVDTYRNLYPDKTGAYSFWTYLSNSRSRNVGWRLDYFITSERFLPNVCDNVMRSEVFGSDHCPITLFAHV